MVFHSGQNDRNCGGLSSISTIQHDNEHFILIRTQNAPVISTFSVFKLMQIYEAKSDHLACRFFGSFGSHLHGACQ